MKQETKQKYLSRIDTCRKLLVEAMQADYTKELAEDSAAEERVRQRVEKMNEVFRETITAQNNLLDGRFVNSVDASNTIYQLEMKVKRLGLGVWAADPEAGDGTDVPSWNSPESIPEDAPDIVRDVASAQAQLLRVYEGIVQEHPIAAHVPAVMDLQIAARGLNAIMQGLAKVGALL